jgi:hypothetical protein
MDTCKSHPRQRHFQTLFSTLQYPPCCQHMEVSDIERIARRVISSSPTIHIGVKHIEPHHGVGVKTCDLTCKQELKTRSNTCTMYIKYKTKKIQFNPQLNLATPPSPLTDQTINPQSEPTHHATTTGHPQPHRRTRYMIRQSPKKP